MSEITMFRSIASPSQERLQAGLPGGPGIHVPSYWVETEPESTTPVSHYLWTLRRRFWRIATLVLVSVIGTLAVSKRLTPIYESTATVDVDRQMPSGIIGQDASRSPLTDPDQFLATQVKLIQSDSVLRPVAEHFRLWEHQADPPGILPLTSESDREAPVLLKGLTVTRPPNTYLLLISYRSTDPKLAADVANAVARSYLEHTYQIRFQSTANLSKFMEKQLEELKAKMERSNAALAQAERELNVIDPEQKINILSARLLSLNTEYTNAETERMRKETAFRSVNGGSLEAAQVSSQGDSLKKLSERLDEAQQHFATVQTHYGENHPEYKKAAAQVSEIQLQLQQRRQNIAQRVAVEYQDAVNRENLLQKAVAETKTEFDKLNLRSFQYQALKREAEADKKLYEELVLKIREAGINAGFQNSAIRIADGARPASKPVFPNFTLNLALAFLLSSIVGMAIVLMADVLDKTVRDPEQVSRAFRTQVVGSIPYVKKIRRALAAPEKAKGKNVTTLDLAVRPSSAQLTIYDEAIRTLRNSILLADFDGRLTSLMIASAAPSEGKTTIAASLAIAHAQHGRKTLLIDCDLRRSGVHKRLGLSVTTGLSDVLNGKVAWRETLAHPPTVPSLDVLLSGPGSRDACDRIGAGLKEILEDARGDYDLIVVDSPPLLGFPEPLQIATSVDGVVVVARSGQTNRKALGLAIATLSRLRANVVGVVMNEMRPDTADGYQYGYYYGYQRS